MNNTPFKLTERHIYKLTDYRLALVGNSCENAVAGSARQKENATRKSPILYPHAKTSVYSN